MKGKKNKKAKRRLVFISLTIIILLGVLWWTVYPNFVKIVESNKEKEELTQEYDNLLDTESQLKSEVTKMQNPEYIARYAKEKYLYSDEDEKIIRID